MPGWHIYYHRRIEAKIYFVCADMKHNTINKEKHIKNGRAPNGQKCQFRAKFGRAWAKILILTGESKSFGTRIMEKTPKQRGPNWYEKVFFDPKIWIFGAKSQFFV